MPPPLQVGHKVWSHKGHVLCVSSRLWAKNRTNWVKTFFFCFSPDFWRKIGLNLSEDLFFCSSTDFWRKIGLNFGRNNFWFRSLFLPNLLNFLVPPFQNRPYAIGCTTACVRFDGPRFEPQATRSRDERVTSRPTGQFNQILTNRLADF